MAEKGKMGFRPIQGHDDHWNLLTSKPTPTRMHFLGPEGIGRKKFARELHTRINGRASFSEYAYDIDPNAEACLALSQFASHASTASFRMVCVELSKVPDDRLTARLVSLLDQESETRIVLLSAFELPEPLSSRVVTFVFQPLGDETITKVLQDYNISPDRINRLVPMAEGSMARALGLRSFAREQDRVLTLLDAVLERDVRTITGMRNTWRPETTTALRKWLQESLTSQWRYFNAADDKALTRQAKMALLHATAIRSQSHYAEIRRAAEDIARGGTGE